MMILVNSNFQGYYLGKSMMVKYLNYSEIIHLLFVSHLWIFAIIYVASQTS